ncbi:hypothetical protein FHG87_011066, partial [Trinorchestia longiramus]
GLFERDGNVRTRNNGQKLLLRNFKTSQAMNFFPDKIAATWNQLPENIVSAGTVNTFKNRLDKFWTTNPPVLHPTKYVPNSLRGVEDRRIVLTKKEESEKPLRQRSWKRRALRYGGVEELLRQKAERRQVRELEAENERLLRLEEEKSKVLGFEESSSADCSNDRSSTSKSNVPSEVQSSYSNVDMDARSGLTRLPMRRSEAARHLHHPGAVPTSRRCSEGDASFTDTYGRSRNRSPHLLAPAPGGYHSQGGRFGPHGHGDRPPLQYSMRESPHQCRPSAASLAHPLPPTLEGMEAQGFPYTTDLRGPPVPTRDHFSPAFRPHHEQGPRAEPEPVPYHFLSRPPPPHPYPLDPLCTPPPRRRHSLHNPAFFNVPPPLANSPDFRHYSSQEDIRCSSEYSVIAPSEPKWSDYGYYTNLGDGAGPEYMPSSSGNFHSGVTPPNAPTGASVAFPPPDHAVIKTELPEVKYEPYDPAFT